MPMNTYLDQLREDTMCTSEELLITMSHREECRIHVMNCRESSTWVKIINKVTISLRGSLYTYFNTLFCKLVIYYLKYIYSYIESQNTAKYEGLDFNKALMQLLHFYNYYNCNNNYYYNECLLIVFLS